MASAAESFRSTCGSERGAPECSKQRAPAATPHVGQATETNCFGVRSAILIRLESDKTWRNTVPFETLYMLARGRFRSVYFLDLRGANGTLFPDSLEQTVNHCCDRVVFPGAAFSENQHDCKLFFIRFAGAPNEGRTRIHAVCDPFRGIELTDSRHWSGYPTYPAEWRQSLARARRMRPMISAGAQPASRTRDSGCRLNSR
jgi:hypothetical protein